MSAVLNALGWEFKIQYRQGILWAALFVLVVWSVLLSLLPVDARAAILPYAIFMDISIFGMYFMAGLLYLEKDEGALEAIVVSPQPRGRYLLLKLISLEMLSVTVAVLLTLVVWRGPINWLYLLAGTLLNGWMMCMLGFMIAARYDSINEFIVPSILYLLPTQLPALYLFGIWESWLLYLIPTQAPLLLIAGAFRSLENWQVLYAFVYGLAACILVSLMAMRTFEEFVVRKRGGRE